MANLNNLLVDVLKLADEIKRLNRATELLSERTMDMDRRLVRLETIVEIAPQQNRLPRDD